VGSKTVNLGDVNKIIGALGPLKAGEGILNQIGEPDHQGWMKKRGERYNSWKLRWFVLKGADLYWLKSNSKTVRLFFFFSSQFWFF
jgi:hypothetical protein